MTRSIAFRRAALAAPLAACLLATEGMAATRERKPADQKPASPIGKAEPQTSIRSAEHLHAFQLGLALARAAVYTEPGHPQPKGALGQKSMAGSILIMLDMNPDVLLPKLAATPGATDHSAILVATGKIGTQLKSKSDAVRHAYALGLAMGTAEGESDLGEKTRASVRLKLTEAQTEAAALNLVPEDLKKILASLDGKVPMQTVHDQIVVLRGQYEG
jgi:hypothetical protein